MPVYVERRARGGAQFGRVVRYEHGRESGAEGAAAGVSHRLSTEGVGDKPVVGVRRRRVVAADQARARVLYGVPGAATPQLSGLRLSRERVRS
jgi:hypothetical protein